MQSEDKNLKRKRLNDSVNTTFNINFEQNHTNTVPSSNENAAPPSNDINNYTLSQENNNVNGSTTSSSMAKAIGSTGKDMPTSASLPNNSSHYEIEVIYAVNPNKT